MGEKGNLLGAGGIGDIGSGVGGGDLSGPATERVESVGGLSSDGTAKGTGPAILDAARSVTEPGGADNPPFGEGRRSGQ
jgi:hypothetical protein